MISPTCRRPATTTICSEEDGMSDLGHNSIAAERLKHFVGRIETLEEERKGLADDVKDIYTEAKAIGFDAKILRKLIALRKQDADARREEQALLALYADAIGLDLI
jgi:uncharacterized protein (UPF0335 family)